MKFKFNAELVKQLYLEGYSHNEIASKIGVNQGSICRCLRILGIKARSDSEALKLAWQKDSRYKKLDLEKLRFLYLKRRIPAAEIAQELNISTSTVNRRLKQLGIRRNRTEAQKLKRFKRQPKERIVFLRYIKVYKPYHYRADKKGYVFEHILNWENFNAMSLPEGYIVHHLNGVKDDNRPKNLLALLKKGHSPSLTVKEVQKRLRELEAIFAQRKMVL